MSHLNLDISSLAALLRAASPYISGVDADPDWLRIRVKKPMPAQIGICCDQSAAADILDLNLKIGLLARAALYFFKHRITNNAPFVTHLDSSRCTLDLKKIPLGTGTVADLLSVEQLSAPASPHAVSCTFSIKEPSDV